MKVGSQPTWMRFLEVSRNEEFHGQSLVPISAVHRKTAMEYPTKSMANYDPIQIFRDLLLEIVWNLTKQKSSILV